MPPLRIENLSIEFPGRYEIDHAVDDASFDPEAGETLLDDSKIPDFDDKRIIELRGSQRQAGIAGPVIRIEQFPGRFPAACTSAP